MFDQRVLKEKEDSKESQVPRAKQELAGQGVSQAPREVKANVANEACEDLRDLRDLQVKEVHPDKEVFPGLMAL